MISIKNTIIYLPIFPLPIEVSRVATTIEILINANAVNANKSAKERINKYKENISESFPMLL